MKINVYGSQVEMRALAELVKYIPPETKEVQVTSPPRRPIDARPCLQPGMLFMDACCDNKLVIHLTQKSVDSPFKVFSSIIGG